MLSPPPASVSAALAERVAAAIDAAGGWLSFDRFMAIALYEPGLGYYANASRKFGWMPSSGSDFVTAPELSPLFGATLARQVVQALDASDTDEVWEFGAGSGALAAQLLDALGPRLKRYVIVDVSGALRERQRERLAAHGATVVWVDALPDAIRGVVVGNEVLDAMPVQLLHWDGQAWHERGVARGFESERGVARGFESERGVARGREDAGFVWRDRATPLRPPGDRPFAPGAVIEIHAQAEAFIATLADRLDRGAAFFIDYGFPEAEFYHPQRSAGTLMCHRAHQADADPLADVGEKDITAHVNFSGIALAGQDAGLDVIGYTTQAHFLVNCGLLDLLDGAGPRTVAPVQTLLAEHEMGELFKVIAFGKGLPAGFAAAAIGFRSGDRTHTL